MNPFDPRAMLFAKHAQHVVVIHLPIGLFVASVGFDLLSRWKKRTSLAAASYYNLGAAAFTSLLALGTGLAAWQWQLEGQCLRGNLLLHLIFAILSTFLVWVLWCWRRRKEPGSVTSTPYLAFSFVALLIVASTGHLGGILSGVNTSGN